MAQCIAARADGSRCRMNAQRKFEGTAAEGLCGRHHHQLASGDRPVINAETGLEIPKLANGST
jgi:hypothetical protein